MPARRFEAGPLLALIGAVTLLVSLFLNWYEPGLNAWDVFELLDIVLAALAVAAGLAAFGMLGPATVGLEPRHLAPLAAAALVLVLVTVLDHPPAVGAATTQTGLWLALAGALILAAGAVLVAARIRISFDVERRRRRVSAVDARRTHGGDEPDEPARPREPAPDEPTRPRDPTPDEPAP